MSRAIIDDEAADAFQRAFESAQGIERRIFRILARGFFNEHGIDEIRHQANAIITAVDDLAKMADAAE